MIKLESLTHFVIDNSHSKEEVGKKKLRTTLNRRHVTTDQLLILSWSW